jgi:RecA/RadA recombinase
MAKKSKKEQFKEATPESVATMMGVPALVAAKPYSYNILDTAPDTMDQVKACMIAAASRKKNRPTDFKTLAEIRRSMMMVRNFYMQNTLGTYGLPQGCAIDIIGQEHIGKTGLLHWLFGGFMQVGAPCYLQHSENKPYKPEWAMRFLHTNPGVSLKMLESMISEPVYSLEHSLESMIRWVDTMRGRENTKERRVNVPLDTPLVIGIDTWSKLLNPMEAAGKYDYGQNLNPAGMKAKKEVGEGSNLGHSKWAHSFFRYMPSWLAANNVILFFVRHQNDKIDMAASGFGFTPPPEWTALRNTTSIGGKGFGQNVAMQFVLANGGQFKDEAGDVIGTTVRMRVNKQSYGPNNREMSWVLQNTKFRDIPGQYIAPALDFDPHMAKWFADKELIGTRVDNKFFTCDALGVTSVDAHPFCRAFEANTEVQNQLGRVLGIDGYIDVVDQIRKDVKEFQNAHPVNPGEPDAPQPPEFDEGQAAE